VRVSTNNLRHFMAAAEQLHFAHAARSENVSRATLIASVKELEAELGYPLFDYSAPTTVLTPAGTALLEKTRIEWAKSAAAARASAPAPGGKAKASKGKGRAPAVKGVRRVGRPRQGR
jgi:DNA-binding transcriptional LysR family regulator